MKSLVRRILQSLGYDIISYNNGHSPGSPARPFGHFRGFLEDIKARGFTPSFILDVGANNGEWTTMAKEVFTHASFLLIEPQPEMKNNLNNLCAKYQDITWVQAGAAAEAGKLVQTIWEDLAGSSFLPTVDDQALQSGKQREVDMITIDSLLASRNLKSPDLVKLDIQGFELEALKGGNSLFGNTEMFILEVSLFHFMPGMPLLREVIDFMAERDYEVYDFPGYLRRPLDGALGQVDIAFAKKAGLMRRDNRWD